MVAHRCGFYFRNMYKCMSQVDDKEDVNVKCPEEFIDWAACIQRMCGTYVIKCLRSDHFFAN